MTLQELEDYDNAHKHKLPDVVIVKKSYPKTRKRQQKRIWKLKRMEMEKADDNNFWGDKKTKKQKNAAVDDAEKDYKEFLDDIEEDPEMRQKIMLFKVISLLCS
jgi:nonsense-mediated mRNA decay protein 3